MDATTARSASESNPAGDDPAVDVLVAEALVGSNEVAVDGVAAGNVIDNSLSLLNRVCTSSPMPVTIGSDGGAERRAVSRRGTTPAALHNDQTSAATMPSTAMRARRPGHPRPSDCHCCRALPP